MPEPTPAHSVPPDPTTPGPTSAPSALGSAVTTTATGLPLAPLIVWLVDTYWILPGGKHMDPTTAAAIAVPVATALGYLFQVLRGWFAKVGIPPPPL